MVPKPTTTETDQLQFDNFAHKPSTKDTNHCYWWARKIIFPFRSDAVH